MGGKTNTYRSSLAAEMIGYSFRDGGFLRYAQDPRHCCSTCGPLRCISGRSLRWTITDHVKTRQAREGAFGLRTDRPVETKGRIRSKCMTPSVCCHSNWTLPIANPCVVLKYQVLGFSIDLHTHRDVESTPRPERGAPSSKEPTRVRRLLEDSLTIPPAIVRSASENPREYQQHRRTPKCLSFDQPTSHSAWLFVVPYRRRVCRL